MNTSLSKTLATFGLAALVLTANAQDKGPTDMNSMGGMKMDCTKNMGNMNGTESMKMDCMAKASTKDVSNVTAMSTGEVKAVDRANNNITLQHGPIKSKTVEMGAMTMTFPVQKPSLLAKVRVGSKVKFIVENVNDAATVTSLVVQK